MKCNGYYPLQYYVGLKARFSTVGYYDEDGNAYLDIDYTDHGNPKTHPIVPHQHHIVMKDGKPDRGKDEEVK